MDRMKTLVYWDRWVILEKEKCPSASVNAKYSTNSMGATMNMTVHTMWGTAAIFWKILLWAPLRLDRGGGWMA